MPVAGVGVEAPVADEVEDVPGAGPHRLLQGLPGLPLQPHQLHQPPAPQGVDRALHALALAGDVQGRQAGRAGHQAQDPQRRGDGQGAHGLGQIEVAHQGRALGEADVVPPAGVEEELPGQRGQRRVADLQAQAQPLARLVGQLPADVVAGQGGAGEQELEQGPAEVLDRPLLRGPGHAAGAGRSRAGGRSPPPAGGSPGPARRRGSGASRAPRPRASARPPGTPGRRPPPPRPRSRGSRSSRRSWRSPPPPPLIPPLPPPGPPVVGRSVPGAAGPPRPITGAGRKRRSPGHSFAATYSGRRPHPPTE